tara:strand:+ start:505 stop:990 length:486 start_codon:yes stop_codon:yes gene_type:complete
MSIDYISPLDNPAINLQLANDYANLTKSISEIKRVVRQAQNNKPLLDEDIASRLNQIFIIHDTKAPFSEPSEYDIFAAYFKMSLNWKRLLSDKNKDEFNLVQNFLNNEYNNGAKMIKHVVGVDLIEIYNQPNSTQRLKDIIGSVARTSQWFGTEVGSYLLR